MALRLGLGGMVRGGKDDVVEARHDFLLAVQLVAPEVFARLAEEVLPLYETLPCWRPPTRMAEVVAAPPLEPDRSKAKAVCEAFKTAVAGWARAHNLDYPWAKDMAVWLLWCWHRFPRWRGQVEPDILPTPVFMLPETPDPPKYIPAVMTQDEYEALVRDYMAQVEAAYGEAGLNKTPVKKNPQAFEWLALRVVRGMTCEAIADMLNNGGGYPDANVISKATADLAGLVAVTLPTKPGRPRKNP